MLYVIVLSLIRRCVAIFTILKLVDGKWSGVKVSWPHFLKSFFLIVFRMNEEYKRWIKKLNLLNPR